MDVMKGETRSSCPHGLTMLARGLTHMEGVLADISPEINMVQIAAARLKGNLLEEGNWKKQMKGTGKSCIAPCSALWIFLRWQQISCRAA